MALQDAQRAMGLLRAQAARWKIDPQRLGVIGFSAGGHVVAGLSTHVQRSYAPLDAADAQSSRPDFAMLLYPGHLWVRKDDSLEKDIVVDAKVPQTFIVQAADDLVQLIGGQRDHGLFAECLEGEGRFGAERVVGGEPDPQRRAGRLKPA